MRFNTLSEWLSWLESCHPQAIELGLDRIAAVASHMQLDLSTSKVITVGGTNGKGSCVAAIDALCRDAGWRVGCYTSPHLLRYNERIVIDGKPVSDSDLIAAFDRVDCALGGVSLTYFEFGTLAALALFQQARLDVVILEVGLGGRLDAVNIIDADIAVVVTVAMDHEDWLGHDREVIGFEKAGIFRAGRPAVCADDNPPQSLVAHAQKIGAKLLLRYRDFDLVKDAQQRLCWGSGAEVARPRPIVDLRQPVLPVASVAAALQVAELLGIDSSHWPCLSNVRVAGRYQRISCRGKQLLLDVAHNPAAAALLATQLAADPCPGRRYVLFAVMADKDIAHMIEPLRQSFAQWWVVGLPHIARAASVTQLENTVRQQVAVPVKGFADIDEAGAAMAGMLEDNDELVVFGSFFTVAGVMAFCQGIAPANY